MWIERRQLVYPDSLLAEEPCELGNQRPAAAMPDEGDRRDRVQVLCQVYEIRESDLGARAFHQLIQGTLVWGNIGESLRANGFSIVRFGPTTTRPCMTVGSIQPRSP